MQGNQLDQAPGHLKAATTHNTNYFSNLQPAPFQAIPDGGPGTSLGRSDVKIDTDSTEGKKTTTGKSSVNGNGKSVKRVPSRTKFGSDKVSSHFHNFTTSVLTNL